MRDATKDCKKVAFFSQSRVRKPSEKAEENRKDGTSTSAESASVKNCIFI